MAEIEITGIRKDNGNHDNPYEAVEAYAWTNHATGEAGIVNRAGGVKWVDDGNKAYVERSRPRADCYVNTSHNGTKFLQTYPDATDANNLLRLPEV
jgi:hypothetical protein